MACGRWKSVPLALGQWTVTAKSAVKKFITITFSSKTTFITFILPAIHPLPLLLLLLLLPLELHRLSPLAGLMEQDMAHRKAFAHKE
jgi:hypothetical protein